MKLIRAKIYGFGKWIDQEFLIDPDYQILFGDNEAGKTTFLTFIKSILFGFASGRGNQKFEQYKPKQGTKYGGELEFIDHDSVHWLLRRVAGKGDGEVTLYRDAQEVPVALINQITGGISKDEFEATHVLNDQMIHSVYDLDQSSLEQEILTMGATGNKQWLQTAEDLKKDSGKIYKQRGTKQPLVKAIKDYQNLTAEKAAFKNQQQQYLETKQKLDQTKVQIEDQKQTTQALDQKQQALSSLVKKLPIYLDFQQLRQQDLHSFEPIDDDDWNHFLQLDQQITTLKESNKLQTSNKISADEQKIIENYYSNQADIDYIKSRQNDIQNSIFEVSHYQDQLRKSDFESDQLKAKYPDLQDEMTLLNNNEIIQLQKSIPKANNNVIIAICLISLLLLFFVPTAVKFVLGVLIIASIGYGTYNTKQVRDNLTKQNEINQNILQQNGYQNSNVDVALKLQPLIEQLNSQKQQQKELDRQLNQATAEINKWGNLLVKVGILQSNIDVNNFIPEMSRYYDQLSEIQAKQKLIDQDNAERNKVLASSNQDLSKLTTELTSILNKYQIDSIDEFKQTRMNQQQKADQINRFNSDKDSLGDDLARFDQLADIDQLQAQLTDAKNDYQEQNEQLNNSLTQQGYLESQLKQVFDDASYQKIVQELLQTKENILELYDEWLSGELASKWINQMLEAASENRYPKMLKLAREYFQILTNNNYIDINMNDVDQLQVTRQDKVKFDVHEISKATTVQLYISLRLAFIIEISAAVELPILIDDAFVDFDQSRLKNIYQLIESISKHNQIIFVTANMHDTMPKDHVLSLEGK